MGKMFFNILATFAEFETDLIRMRTREGMAVARAKGKLRGKKPKLSDRYRPASYGGCTTPETTASATSPRSSRSPVPPSTELFSGNPPAT